MGKLKIAVLIYSETLRCVLLRNFEHEKKTSVNDHIDVYLASVVSKF